MSDGAAIGFWKTVGLLLKTTQRRSQGRQHRQQELLNNRGGTNWGGLATLFTMGLMAFLHGAAAFAVMSGAKANEITCRGCLLSSLGCPPPSGWRYKRL